MGKIRERFVVDESGKETSVVISLKDYERLMADLYDLAIVAERRDEEAISLEEITRRLRDDGLL